MATVKTHNSVHTTLATGIAAGQSFGLKLVMVDDDQIPVDARYRIIGSDEWTDLDSNTSIYSYCQTFFMPNEAPSEIMLGRYISTASSPYWVAGPSINTTLATWQNITSGTLTIVDDSTPSAYTVTVSGISFAAITSLAQIPEVIEAELQDLTTPAIDGLDEATCFYDSLGRLVISMATTGADAPQIHVTAGTVSALLDITNGITVAGYDAEDIEDAVSAVSDYNDGWWLCDGIGLDVTEQTDLAVFLESTRKAGNFSYYTADAINSGATSDIGYILKALGIEKTLVTYTQRTTQYPSAAISGRFLTAEEGSTAWEHKALKNVSDSGLNRPLTTSEKTVLRTKGYNYIETIEGNNTNYPGLCVGGEEMRIILFADWWDSGIATSLYNIRLTNDLTAFDDTTMAQVNDILVRYRDEGVARRCLFNSEAKPFTITLPDPADFTAEQLASHEMELPRCYKGYLVSAVTDFTLTGTFQF